MMYFFLTQAPKCDIINLLCWCFEKYFGFFQNPIDKRIRMCYNIIRWRKSVDTKEYGSVPERPKGADCKSVVTDFGGPNPPAPTKIKGRTASCLLFWWEWLVREARTRGSQCHILCACFISLACQRAALVCGHESTRSPFTSSSIYATI